jgi:hypothetical protein
MFDISTLDENIQPTNCLEWVPASGRFTAQKQQAKGSTAWRALLVSHQHAFATSTAHRPSTQPKSDFTAESSISIGPRVEIVQRRSLMVRATETNPTTQRHRSKGGWRSRSGLAWSEVKDVTNVAHAARFNTYLDIMPVAGTDQQRKRYCALVVARLGQSLKRRGRQHVGVTTYEKSSTASVHGHHMCRLERCDWDLLQRYDGHIIRAGTFPLGRLGKVVSYRTKQRLPLSPDFEERTNHRRQRGAPIRGRRASFTNAARTLLQALSSNH